MKGEGEGEYLHLSVGRVSLGEGGGPKNWRRWGVLSVDGSG